MSLTKEQVLIAKVLRHAAADVHTFNPELQAGASAAISALVLDFLDVFNRPGSKFKRFEFFDACQPQTPTES